MIKRGDYSIDYTNKLVMVYQGGKLIGQAGVQNSKDFDFEKLYRLALKKSGSTITSD